MYPCIVCGTLVDSQAPTPDEPCLHPSIRFASTLCIDPWRRPHFAMADSRAFIHLGKKWYDSPHSLALLHMRMTGPNASTLADDSDARFHRTHSSEFTMAMQDFIKEKSSKEKMDGQIIPN